MGASTFVLFFLFLCYFAISCYALTLSSLPRSLLISASTSQDQVLKAGKDEITVSWSYNTTFAAGTESLYKTIKVSLCYAPISQKDRGWRKTVDLLSKDKTCQFNVVERKPYNPSNNTITWTIERNVPSATYFIRAYAYNSAGQEIAFGQTTNALKTINLFVIQAISGRHASVDIAAICFSAFSLLSLFGFFFLEKRKSKAKAPQQK